MGLKIAFFHNLPTGGAKRSHYEQIKRLCAKHEIHLYNLSTTDEKFLDISKFCTLKFSQKYTPMNWNISLLNPFLELIKIYRLDKVAREIAKKINRSNYNLAYVTHHLLTHAPQLLRYIKIPTVYYCQEPPRRFYEEPQLTLKRLIYWPIDYIYRLFDKKNTNHATVIITNSNFSKENIKRIYRKNAHVIYHGVDTEKFRPLGINKENLIVSVGALHPLKGHDFVIESISLIPQEIRPNLVIVCDREYRNERTRLRKLSKKREVNLEIKKMITEEELIKIYNQAKITVYTPINEPFGLVPLESMACGVPVIGINEGGVKETVIDGVVGYLTNRNPLECTEKIKKLLLDDHLRKKMGESARKYVQNRWSWEKSVKNLEEIFKMFV